MPVADARVDANVRNSALVLLAASACVLIIACVNVASLLLARSAERERDLAVRAALGCSRTRLVRQLLMESLLLSLAGAVAGLLVAPAATRVLLALAPAAVARAWTVTPDRAVLAFTIGIALLTGTGFGVAPAAQIARTNLEGMLRESGRAGGRWYRGRCVSRHRKANARRSGRAL